MPPAFNLSQDQTLQFDLCKLTHLNVGPIPSRFRPETRRSASPPSLMRKPHCVVRALRLSWISPAASPSPGYPENSPPQGPRPRVPTPIGCTLLKSVPLAIHFETTHFVRECAPRCLALAFLGVSKQQRGEIIMTFPWHCNTCAHLSFGGRRKSDGQFARARGKD